MRETNLDFLLEGRTVREWIATGVEEQWPDEVFDIIVREYGDVLRRHPVHWPIYHFLRRSSLQGELVLDAGCGTGPMWLPLVEAGVRGIVGLDIDELRLRKGRRRALVEGLAGIVLVRTNIHDGLPFASSSFDLVLMIEVIEHLIHQEQLAHEVYRVLRPGGKWVITTPNRGFLWRRFRPAPSSARPYSSHQHWIELTGRELTALVQGAGFAVVNHHFFHLPKLHRMEMHTSCIMRALGVALKPILASAGGLLMMNQLLVAARPG